MIRDIMSSLRPHLKLSKSLEEAKEALDELQKKLLAKLEPSASHGSGDGGGGGGNAKNVPEGQLSTIYESEIETKADAESTDESATVVRATSADPDDNEDEDEDDEPEELDEMDEEEELEPEMSYEFSYHHQEPTRERKLDQEDAAFADAFDRMVSDDIQDRLRETVKPQQIDISVPYNVRNSLKKNYEQLQTSVPTEQEKSSVNFVVLLRKGNKQQYKNLEIPLDSDLAKNLKSQEKAERVEMEKVKRLTLDINERLEEEDYQDQIQAYTQKQLPAVSGRDKKKKYQHPKGVPDADLIFGKKKVQYK